MHAAIVFSNGFQRWIDRVGTDGLSYERLRLLEILHCTGPKKMRELADELSLTPRNITDAIDALEREGLLRRMPHPTDRRATLIQLTALGVETSERELAPRLETISGLFAELPEADQRRLTRLLDTLTEGLRRRGQRV